MGKKKLVPDLSGPLLGQPTSSIGSMRIENGFPYTYSGISFNDATSLLDICIVNSDNERAVMLAVELYHINKISDDYYEVFIDRLKSIASKRIGIGNYHLTLSIIDYLNRYAHRLSYVEVISLVITMCDSVKDIETNNYYRLACNTEADKICQELYKNKLSIAPVELMKLYSKTSKDYNIFKKEINAALPYGMIDDDIFELHVFDETLKRYKQLGKAKITHLALSLKRCLDALSKYTYNRDIVCYIDEYGTNHVTRNSTLILWDIIQSHTSKGVNDSFWIANNILRYAYFSSDLRDPNLLFLAASSSKLIVAYAEVPLRFDEADPMEKYFINDINKYSDVLSLVSSKVKGGISEIVTTMLKY